MRNQPQMGLRQAYIRYIYARVYLKKLQKYKHQNPSKPQYAPYPTTPRKYGATSQEPTPQDTAPPATKEEITHIQQFVGSILYYAIAVVLNVLMALSNIDSEKAKATKTTLKMYIKFYIIWPQTQIQRSDFMHKTWY